MGNETSLEYDDNITTKIKRISKQILITTLNRNIVSNVNKNFTINNYLINEKYELIEDEIDYKFKMDIVLLDLKKHFKLLDLEKKKEEELENLINIKISKIL